MRSSSLNHVSFAVVFVYGVWAVMTGLLIYLVARYAYNLPWQDDFIFLDVATGNQPINLAWLWSEHNEHRIPITRIAMVLLYRWTGDFRSPMFVTVGAFVFLAFALIRAAGTARGRVEYSDAIFPLILLNWGHAEVFLWGCVIQYTVSVLLVGIFLYLVSVQGESLSLRAIFGAGFCLLLFPLTGANGLALAPVLGAWLFGMGAVRSWMRGPTERKQALISFGFVLVGALMTASYFVGSKRLSGGSVSLGLQVRLHAILAFVTGGFGPAASWYWPTSGYLTIVLLLAALITLGLRLAGGFTLDRTRAFGLWAVLGSLGCLSLALGWGRSFVGFFPPYSVIRYASLTAMVPCAAYLVWASPRFPQWDQWMQRTLFAVVCLITPFNMQVGLDWARTHGRPFESMTHEIAAGTPASILAEHHGTYLFPWKSHAWVAEQIQRLHDAGFAAFQQLGSEVEALREKPLGTAAVGLHDVAPLDAPGRYFVRGPEPSLRFQLDQPQFVHAVRLQCVYDPMTDVPIDFKLTWQKISEGKLPRATANYQLDVGDPFGLLWPGATRQVEPGGTTITVLIDATIDRFELQPSRKPCGFQLDKLTLLLPIEPDSQGKTVSKSGF